MNHIHPTVIILFLFSIPLFSQKSILIGTVADSSGIGLSGATVVLMQAQDSVLSSFGVSENDGHFALKRVASGDYMLQISYVGYETFWQNISVANNAGDVDVGKLLLTPASANLSTVEVMGEHVPLRMKNDTLEYNADAFKTQPGSVVEDLLKKLPGVEVERDGTIKAQGETVQNVLVDGKEFFGNDPKIATKNLPADAVDKVQLFDKKSDFAEFTGIEDGRDEKTINLALKDGKKSGYFGNGSAGGGAMQKASGGLQYDRFQGKFNLNRFSKNTQISAIGMGNNINEQGFSFNEYLRFLGGLSNFMSGGGSSSRVKIELDDNSGLPLLAGGLGNGFTTTWAGGVNLNHDFSKKTKLNASYFFNRIQNEVERSATRENFVGDENYRSQEEEDRLSRNANHRLNMTLRHEIDSFQNIILRSNFGLNDALFKSDGLSSTFNTEGILENTGLRNYRSDGENLSMDANLSYRRRFRRPGRAFLSNISFGAADDERSGSLFSQNNFYLGQAQTETVDQHQAFNDDAMNYGLRLSYTEPIGKGQYIELNASRQNYSNEVQKDFFDRLPGQPDTLNTALSNHFDRGYRYDRGGMNYMLNRKKFNLTAGAALQQSKLDGHQLDENTDNISRSFTRILPSLFFNYEFGTSRNLNLEYSTNLREPSLEQLQPVVDNSDPLNIYIGNPGLQPEYMHELDLRYFLFDQFTFTSFFANLSGNYTKNRITNASTIDDQFRRSTTPVNVDWDYGLRGGLQFQTPIRPVKMNIRLTYNALCNKGLLFVNNVENTSDRQRHSFGLSFDNRKKDLVDFTIGAKISHNRSSYSVSEALNQTYLDQRYYADIIITPSDKWEFSSNFDYTIYSNESFGAQQKVPIWKAGLSYYFLKGSRGKLILSAFDILNQNIGINRSSQLNYVEEERIRSLGRYVMLTFAYSISGFGPEGNGGIEIRMENDR